MEENQQKKNNLHKVIRNVLAKFCDECGTRYDDNDIKIVQKNNQGLMVHLSCKNCGKTHLATIIKPLGITNRMPIKTDLHPEEIDKFAGKESVSADDILDVYEWCKNTNQKKSLEQLQNLFK